MKLKLLIASAIISGFLYTSCSSATQKKVENVSEETTEDSHDHDHSDHDATTAALTVPEGAKVFFANIQDGDVVTSPLKIEFGVEGMEVEPAGELHQGMGHHHLLINGQPLASGTVVPADSVNIHYGKGQIETEIELTPGEYKLVMQFADGYHQSYGEQMSSTITVMVE